VPRQLPAPPRAFAGRDRELAELDALLEAVNEQPNTVVISALSGTGGVGKTALALHWARRVADRFPDGQLYLNLRGFDPSGSAMTATEAVRSFLEALNVHPQRVPDSFDAQVGLYRSLLADRRMIVLLDNARNVEQIRPLLPGSPGCLALVTSRNQLTGLVVTEGATPLSLDLLSHHEARAMLAQRLGPGRLAAEPQAAEALVTFCGRLPLALAIVAARAAMRRSLPLGALADELSDSRARLDALGVDDPTSDLRAVFSWSYTALAPEAAQMFRLLGLHPGPAFSSWAVASLTGHPEHDVRGTLADLTAANLLTELGPGRFSFHDLLRAYAEELAETSETPAHRDAARLRLLGHYLHTADMADRLIYPHRDPIDLPRPEPGLACEHLADATQALDWFSREGPVLLSVVRQAQSLGFDTYAGRLTWTMVNFLDRRGLWSDWVDVQRTALEAAMRASDPEDLAIAHRGLARAYLQLGRHDDVGTHGECALDLYRRLGDHAGEAQTHLMLGMAAARTGDNATALTHFLHAKNLYEANGHQAGRANSLNNAGWTLTMLGDNERAAVLCAQAVEIQQTIGDRYLLGGSWDSLGYVHARLGHHEKAISCFHNALALAREQGDRYAEAEALDHLGDSFHETSDDRAAADHWRSAAAIYEELGHPNAAEIRSKLESGQRRSSKAASDQAI
jgi:tetratricopeptide (TPR) repeat protein